jgi:plastocyanin
VTRTRIGIVVGLATLALAAAGCGGGDNESATGTTETTSTETTTSTSTETGMTLDASVGPGFVISLKGSDGQDVTTLTAGTYTINVDDQSDIHNFHLTGPGVDEMTEVGATGTTTWTVTFQDGSYHFQCDPHASTMNGDFEVSG